MSEKTTRLYELGFILVPIIPETEIPNKVESLKSLIKGVEGEIVSEGTPEYIDLAYTIEKTFGSKKSKYSQGYFGFIKFNSEPETLESLKKNLDQDNEVVRYLLIKTQESNTISFKKPKIEAKRESLVDEDILDEEEEVSAHEALPDLLPDIESQDTEKESE